MQKHLSQGLGAAAGAPVIVLRRAVSRITTFGNALLNSRQVIPPHHLAILHLAILSFRIYFRNVLKTMKNTSTSTTILKRRRLYILLLASWTACGRGRLWDAVSYSVPGTLLFSFEWFWAICFVL